MRSLKRKTQAILVMSLLAAESVQSAAPVDRSRQVNPVNVYSDTGASPCCEPAPKPCYGYAYNPPLFFNDCCGWAADIEFLYFKPYQEGISYGSDFNAKNVTIDDVTSATYGNFRGNVQNPKFEWDSGFRLGVGYALPNDAWLAMVEYTHYRTVADGSLNTNYSDATGTGNLFLPTYSVLPPVSYNGTAIVPASQSANVNWTIQFNQVDLDIGREYIVGRNVTVKPYVGLRALFIDEKYQIEDLSTRNMVVGSTAVTGSTEERFYFDNSFKGVGLKAGLDSSYGFACGLSIYGGVDGSLVFGQYEVSQKANGIDILIPSGDTTQTNSLSFEVTNQYTTIAAAADLSLGLQWRDMFNYDRSVVTLRFGWEHHVFFDYNKFRALTVPATGPAQTTDSSGGDLSLYGVIFSATVDF